MEISNIEKEFFTNCLPNSGRVIQMDPIPNEVQGPPTRYPSTNNPNFKKRSMLRSMSVQDPASEQRDFRDTTQSLKSFWCLNNSSQYLSKSLEREDMMMNNEFLLDLVEDTGARKKLNEEGNSLIVDNTSLSSSLHSWYKPQNYITKKSDSNCLIINEEATNNLIIKNNNQVPFNPNNFDKLRSIDIDSSNLIKDELATCISEVDSISAEESEFDPMTDILTYKNDRVHENKDDKASKDFQKARNYFEDQGKLCQMNKTEITEHSSTVPTISERMSLNRTDLRKLKCTSHIEGDFESSPDKLKANLSNKSELKSTSSQLIDGNFNSNEPLHPTKLFAYNAQSIETNQANLKKLYNDPDSEPEEVTVDNFEVEAIPRPRDALKSIEENAIYAKPRYQNISNICQEKGEIKGNINANYSIASCNNNQTCFTNSAYSTVIKKSSISPCKLVLDDTEETCGQQENEISPDTYHHYNDPSTQNSKDLSSNIMKQPNDEIPKYSYTQTSHLNHGNQEKTDHTTQFQGPPSCPSLANDNQPFILSTSTPGGATAVVIINGNNVHSKTYNGSKSDAQTNCKETIDNAYSACFDSNTEQECVQDHRSFYTYRQDSQPQGSSSKLRNSHRTRKNESFRHQRNEELSTPDGHKKSRQNASSCPPLMKTVSLDSCPDNYYYNYMNRFDELSEKNYINNSVDSNLHKRHMNPQTSLVESKMNSNDVLVYSMPTHRTYFENNPCSMEDPLDPPRKKMQNIATSTNNIPDFKNSNEIIESQTEPVRVLNEPNPHLTDHPLYTNMPAESNNTQNIQNPSVHQLNPYSQVSGCYDCKNRGLNAAYFCGLIPDHFLSWRARDTTVWLQCLGHPRLANLASRTVIDGSQLANMTADDFKNLDRNLNDTEAICLMQCVKDLLLQSPIQMDQSPSTNFPSHCLDPYNNNNKKNIKNGPLFRNKQNIISGSNNNGPLPGTFNFCQFVGMPGNYFSTLKTHPSAIYPSSLSIKMNSDSLQPLMSNKNNMHPWSWDALVTSQIPLTTCFASRNMLTRNAKLF